MLDEVIGRVEGKMHKILLSILFYNELDLTNMADDGIWFVGSAMEPFTKSEIPSYLMQNRIELPSDIPQITFLKSKYLGSECVCLNGVVRYHGQNEPQNLIQVTFHSAWQNIQNKWKLEQLITSSLDIDFASNNASGDTRINGRLLLKSIPMGIICCRIDDMLPVSLLNEQLLGMLQYQNINEYMQYSGMSLLSSVHPEDISLLLEYVERVKSGERVEDYIQFRLRRKNFTYLMVQVLGMLIDQKWIMLACTDYTLHQIREEAVEKEKSKLLKLHNNYRNMLDNMPAGFRLCDLHGSRPRVEYFSDSLCKMTLYSQHDIRETMKASYVEIIVPEDRGKFLDCLNRLADHPDTGQVSYRIKRKDGSIIRVLDRIRSVRHEDGKMFCYAVIVRINDQEAENTAAEQKEMPELMPPAEEGETHVVKTVKGHVVELLTFGYFEMRVDGAPVAFRSAKARELLALLVDRRGNFVSRESIISMLWEYEPLNPTTVTRCRKTFKYLVDELKEYGIEDIVETKNNMRRLVTEKVNCDFYDYLNGDTKATKAFQGTYLSEYSWSEITLSTLLQTEFSV